jgi:hypothetical protein
LIIQLTTGKEGKLKSSAKYCKSGIPQQMKFKNNVSEVDQEVEA